MKNPTSYRPKYHFTAKKGWLNDPNGMIYFKGNYHMFYQHNPYSVTWDSMHWGHAISKDGVVWEHLPVALKPDMPYDDYKHGGCFSGTAIEHEGKLYLFYTGSHDKNKTECQTQNVAISEDGIHFKKYEGNPIISKLPHEESSWDIRDPKVFRHKDTFYMLLGTCQGNQETDGIGKILMYESRDLLHWDYKSIFFDTEGIYGKMVECPDLFPLEDKWILMYSPMYAVSKKKVIYFCGDIDFETGKFIVKSQGDVNNGFEFYAPQSFQGENGEVYGVAWMDAWQNMPWFHKLAPTENEEYRGCMSLLRRYFFNEKEELCALPIDAYEKARITSKSYENVSLSKEKLYFDVGSDNRYELIIKADIRNMTSSFFTIGLMANEEDGIYLHMDLTSNILTFDRNHLNEHSIGMMSTKLDILNFQLELRIFVDVSTIEIFADGGKVNLSYTAYPREEQRKLWINVPYGTGSVDKLEIHQM